MSDRTLMINVPELAPKDFERTFDSRLLGEALVWENIILRFDEAKDERSLEDLLEGVSQFTDETLWRILDYRVPYPQRQRRRELIDKNGGRSQDEETELDHLMATYDRFILVRSQALLSLKQRGYDMDRYLKDQHL